MPAKKTTARKTTTSKAPAKKVETKPEESLDISANEALKIEENSNQDVPVDDFASAELAALKEELAKVKAQLAEAKAEEESSSEDATSTSDSDRPVPEEELTPEQRQIRLLQDELARVKGQELTSAEEFEEEFDGDGILIHVLVDGFTAMGRVFYRGQEIVFGPEAYNDTKDRLGHSWLTMSESEQYELWGRAMFGRGEWPGKKEYEDTNKSIRVNAPITRY